MCFYGKLGLDNVAWKQYHHHRQIFWSRPYFRKKNSVRVNLSNIHLRVSQCRNMNKNDWAQLSLLKMKIKKTKNKEYMIHVSRCSTAGKLQKNSRSGKRRHASTPSPKTSVAVSLEMNGCWLHNDGFVMGASSLKDEMSCQDSKSIQDLFRSSRTAIMKLCSGFWKLGISCWSRTLQLLENKAIALFAPYFL